MKQRDDTDKLIDAELEQKVEQLYHQREQEISPLMAARLQAARKTALEKLESQPRSIWNKPQQWIAGTALASVFAAFVSWNLISSNSLELRENTLYNDSTNGFEDIALLSAEEDLDLLDNHEFYYWLEQQEQLQHEGAAEKLAQAYGNRAVDGGVVRG